MDTIQLINGITGMEKCQENIGASGSQTPVFGL
jgi:hypothetical protein